MKFLVPKSVLFIVLCLIFINSSTITTQLINEPCCNHAISQENFLINNKIIHNQKTVQNNPILISSENDFVTNGFSGSGTENDPYILEGLDFLGPMNFITISGTTSHFRIINNSFTSTGDESVAISLNSIKNGIIENNELNNFKTGISLTDSENNLMSNNRIYYDSLKIDKSQIGILLTDSHFNIINNNFFLRYPFSAISVFGDNNYIENNSFIENKHGIIISGSYNQIKGNIISNSTFGITLTHEFKFITNNSIKLNLFENSNFPYTSEWGVYLYPKAHNTSILNNNFIGSPQIYAFDNGLNNQFESNYWDDWSGIGSYSVPGLVTNYDLSPSATHNVIQITEIDTKTMFGQNTENTGNSNFIIDPVYLQILALSALIIIASILGILYIKRSRRNPSFSRFIQLGEEGFLRNIYNKLIIGLENAKTYVITPETQNYQITVFETESIINYFPEDIREELISSIKGRSVLVLIEIAYNDPETTNPAYLSKILNIPPSTLTSEIKKLQKMNYINPYISKRVLEDPRYKNYVISEKGFRFLTLLKETIKITLDQNKSVSFS
ncbi:MAG: right-handed parallel beta-helix repeat-containing protein [Candidatus Hodarchaeales archaeon]